MRWVLDADIREFFDNIDHEWLLKFLEHGIADRRIPRLIRKWLKAGCRRTVSGRRRNRARRKGTVISAR